MKELFYVGKRISTGKKVLVLMDDFGELPKEKATQSLLDMGIEVDTNKIVVRDIPEKPEMGTQEFFDQNDCWNAIGGDWMG